MEVIASFSQIAASVTCSGGTWLRDREEAKFLELVAACFPSTIDRISSEQVALRIDSQTSGLREFVAKRFLEVPDAEAVAFQYGEDALHVWTLVSRWADAEVEKIYALELDIMDRFEGQRFDFYVVLLADRPIESFLRDEGVYVIRRADADN